MESYFNRDAEKLEQMMLQRNNALKVIRRLHIIIWVQSILIGAGAAAHLWNLFQGATL